MTITKEVRVTQEVKVTIDETKFTPEFMEEFRASFFPFHEINEHLEHLGQLYARGIYDDGDFIEGYGPAKEMGIRFEHVYGEQEVLES